MPQKKVEGGEAGESTTEAMAAAAGSAPAPTEAMEPAAISISVADTTVTDVTVYVDRAEVTRVVEVTPKHVGPHAIKIKGLTDFADTNSIRVQGEGVAATILEVSFAKTYGMDEGNKSEHSEKVKDLMEKAKVARAEVARLRAAAMRVEQQDKFLAGFVDTALNGNAGDGKAPPPQLTENLGKVQEIFEFFSTKATSIDAAKRDLQTEREEAEVASRSADQELSKYRSIHASNKPSNDITVQLTTLSDANDRPLLLKVSYMVRGASWLPSYDLRASVEPASIQLTYFGMVKQSTGEDWINAKVSLSTASPASAGTPPAPPTKVVQWKHESYGTLRGGGGTAPMARSKKMMRREMPQQAMMAMPMASNSMDRRLSMDADELEMDDAVAVTTATAGVTSSGTGTSTFEIEHPSTIEADSKEHKVTITVMELEPNFEYFCTPALNNKAYLQARVANTSAFPFLESERGNIFLDGSFVSSTHIKAANPGENFSIFLGVDSSIKVEHRQIKQSSSEGHKGSTFKSATESTETHEYVTLVTNTKPKETIKITIVQILPRASDDKIDVELVSPNKKLVTVQGDSTTDDEVTAKKEGGKKDDTVDEGEFKISQNKSTNNLVFSGLIEAKEKRKIDFSYVIKWPVTAGTGKIEVV
eukprot:m.225530 g.225530  ORF g.225530 m.225530 type:complete len:646 (-) comp25904_c0_seq1:89-2026(-)